MLLLQRKCSLKSKLRPLMYKKRYKMRELCECLYMYLFAYPAFA